MSNLNKVLVVIFTLLLIVIFSEAGYFFFLKPQSEKPTPQVARPIIVPEISNNVATKEGLLNNGYRNYLSSIQKNDYASYYLTITIKGYIGDVSLKPYEKNGKNYIGYVTIVDKNNNLIEKMPFTDEMSKILDLNRATQNRVVKIQLTDLKLSQAVEFTSVIDLKRGIKDDIISYKLTVL